MKKIYTICIFCLISACLCFCKNSEEEIIQEKIYEDVNDKYSEVMEAVDELNSNSNIGILLNQDSGMSESEKKNYSGDPPYTIYTSDWLTKGYCYKYPEDAQDYTVTQIVVKSDKSDVFGIKINDRVDVIHSIMEKFGYKKCQCYEDECMKFDKKDIHISFYYKDNVIHEITICLYEEEDDAERR